MAHLIQPLSLSPENPQSLQDYYHTLKAAHDYLLIHAHKALNEAAQLEAAQGWASRAKRIQIQFPDGLRPLYIAPKIESHNLVEVINQCATMERLLDALQWASQNLGTYKVIRCHPTTSSNKTDENPEIPDNDLVLVNHLGQFARFEVSDIVSNKDTNRKEPKDLASLGVMQNEAKSRDRLFLVVSSEFAGYLRSRAKNKSYSYEEHPVSESTVIFEVHLK